MIVGDLNHPHTNTRHTATRFRDRLSISTFNPLLCAIAHLGARRGPGRSGEAILDLALSGTQERIHKAIVAEVLHNSSPSAVQFSIAQGSQDQTAASDTKRKQMLKISVRLIKQSLKGF